MSSPLPWQSSCSSSQPSCFLSTSNLSCFSVSYLYEYIAISFAHARTNNTTTGETIFYNRPDGKNCLDDIKEVMEMLKFDVKVAATLRDCESIDATLRDCESIDINSDIKLHECFHCIGMVSQYSIP